MTNYFWIALGVSLVSVLVPAAAQSPLPPALVQSCETCHGKNGDSQKPDVPRINGQRKDYILTRLRQFLDPTANTPHANQMMWPNAAHIRDDQAVALADYFSRQMPTSADAFPFGFVAEKGADIYRNGDTPDIAACAICHGAQGEGLGGTPRLVGQKEDYLVSQLQSFMLTARVGSPMNHHAWDMNQAQMKALAAYLSHN